GSPPGRERQERSRRRIATMPCSLPSRTWINSVLMVSGTAFVIASASRADAPPAETLAAQLSRLEANVFPTHGDRAKELGQMLYQDMRGRRDAVNQRDVKAWQEVKSRADWERLRDARMQALRASLGTFPAVPENVIPRITRTLDGDGYRIQNLVFEGRPGL